MILLLLAGAGTVIFMTLGGGGGDDETAPQASASASPSVAEQPGPREPGIEPPTDGEWPGDWPHFGPGDQVRRIEHLPGFPFAFEVPAQWECNDAGGDEGASYYTCGIPGGDPQVGGDLLIRACPDPCDADRRVDMRRAEEAWGVQWVRDGGYLAWGETTVDVAGLTYYRVVFVGYYRSSQEARIDRQVVFRMTVLADDQEDLRKTANSVRSGFR